MTDPHKPRKARVFYDWEHMVWVPRRLNDIDAIMAQMMNRAVRIRYVGGHR